MPRPLDPDKRAAILADVEAGGDRNAIARKHGVAPSTVTRFAKKAGKEDAFDRSKTQKATEAKQADDKARLAAIRTRLINLSEAALDQTLAELPELKADKAATVLGIALDKYIALDKHGTDPHGLSAVDAWLAAMLGEDDS